MLIEDRWPCAGSTAQASCHSSTSIARRRRSECAGRIEAHRDYLLSLIRHSPDMTLLEIQERLIANCGERFAVSVLWRFAA